MAKLRYISAGYCSHTYFGGGTDWSQDCVVDGTSRV